LNFNSGDPSRKYLLILLVIAAIGCYGAWKHLDRMRHHAVTNYAKLLKYRKEKSENAEHWRDD
jgi:hypothetical protein